MNSKILWILTAVAILVFGALSYEVWVLNQKIGSVSVTGAAVTSFGNLDGEPMIGAAEAPVTIIAFGDYECPYCKRFHTQTFAQIQSAYIDTGKVKYVARNFPLAFHQYAHGAAVASECALEQNQFWSYHELLYTTPDLSPSNLISLAKTAGMDTNEFQACLSDPAISTRVRADIREGERLGVSGTPAFVINGELVSGAQPFSMLSAIIEQKLSS